LSSLRGGPDIELSEEGLTLNLLRGGFEIELSERRAKISSCTTKK
jgi:hypothetical protein